VDLLDCELFDLSSVTYVTNMDLINTLLDMPKNIIWLVSNMGTKMD
jgi:hypothetical protein